MKRQRGMVLLPVTLALAIVGTLAYAMTRAPMRCCASSASCPMPAWTT